MELYNMDQMENRLMEVGVQQKKISPKILRI